MIDVVKCCANCEYWELRGEDSVGINCDSEGECHRYPPNVPNFDVSGHENAKISDTWIECLYGTPLMSHPFTYACEWCGEFACVKEPRLLF